METMLDWLEERGEKKGLDRSIARMLKKNQAPEFISEMLGSPIEHVYEIQQELLSVHEKSSYEGEV
jgi:hypothetical protein